MDCWTDTQRNKLGLGIVRRSSDFRSDIADRRTNFLLGIHTVSKGDTIGARRY